MLFDDRLATVLRSGAAGEQAARTQFRQLLDLLGSLPPDAAGPLVDAAYRRLGEICDVLPAPEQSEILREPGLRLRNARLIGELAQCAPFLHRQVELVNPTLLVTLGNVPTQALFATNQGITRMRGTWKPLEIGSWSGPVLPTLHPAFLLRTPSAKAQAWKDMLSLKQAMAREGLT